MRELAAIYTDKIHRSHDAIDAFERLRVLAPADTSVLFKLAELFGAVGRWSKVIETLIKVSEIAEGSDEARSALRSIAQIYEKELEIPDRAIESYEAVTQTWPDDNDAWAALDRLYESAGAVDRARRRAAPARRARARPAERAQLLARRANVLSEWLDSPEEAAAALRHARTIAPDDGDLADQMVGTLAKAGRDREAAALLEARLAAMEPRCVEGRARRAADPARAAPARQARRPRAARATRSTKRSRSCPSIRPRSPCSRRRRLPTRIRARSPTRSCARPRARRTRTTRSPR